MLIKLWERRFDSEIRGVHVADINSDGLDEVILASHDSRIYAISHNKVLWSTEEQEFPGENVTVIKTSMGKPHRIVGSFHKELIYFDLEGKKLHKTSLSSWIVRLINIGPSKYGIDALLAVDLRGTIYCVDPEGNISWRLEKALQENSLNRMLYGIAVDNELQRIFLADRHEIKVIDFDGTLRQTKSITREDIHGIAIVNIVQESHHKVKMLAVGTRGGVILLDLVTLKELARTDLGSKRETRVLLSCDINSDMNDEVFIGSWSEDQVIVLEYNEKEKKLKEIAKYNIEGNPLCILAGDFRGCFQKEIVIGTDGDRAYAVIWPKDVIELEASVSLHSICFGNTLGYGPQDILLRSNKETMTCYSFVPRVWSKLNNFNTLEGMLYAIIPSTAKIKTDKVVILDTKNRKVASASLDKKKISLCEIPFKAAYKGGISELTVEVDNKALLRSFILVPDTGKLTVLTRSLALAEEDIITIDDIKVDKKELEVKSRGLEIVKTLVKDNKLKLGVVRNTSDIAHVEISVYSYNEQNKERQMMRKYNFMVVPLETLRAELQIDEMITTEDAITLHLRNNSGKEIPYNIISDGPLNIKASGELLPHSEKPVKLTISVKSDELQIEVNQVLDLTYGDYLRRTIKIPIRSRVLNVSAINERARRIYAATKDLRVVFETLSKDLNLSEEVLKKVVRL
ncbi:MAG: hypothetical protein NDP22_00070 [Crenarchaeota archaeon]|nr:hypothetical protein [Thermoproteota archaeon]